MTATTDPGQDAGADRTEWFRTSPVSPLVNGWKSIVGLWAAALVIFQDNLAALARLAEGATLVRVLLVLAGALVIAALAIGVGTIAWWRTRYRITDEAIEKTSGLLSRHESRAPMDRIESVDLTRPLMARIFGFAAVRIETAGGSGDSGVEIAYLRSERAEELRERIMAAVHRRRRGSEHTLPPSMSQDPASAPDAPAAPSATREGAGPSAHVPAVMLDGVTDGVGLASVPTARLLRSMARDLGLWAGVIGTAVLALVAIPASLAGDGISVGTIIFVLIPAIIAGPRVVFDRLEKGWGFTSRVTEHGIRLRRGLLNTTGQNIVPDRVQAVRILQPLLWRGPTWYRLRATIAGYGEGESASNGEVLPVGTEQEARATLARLLPDPRLGPPAPVDAPDDARARDLLDVLAGKGRDDGFTVEPDAARFLDAFSIRRAGVRTTGTVLMIRAGVVRRELMVIPLDRIQSTHIQQGPLERRLGLATVRIRAAGATTATGIVQHLSADDAWALLDRLSRVAGTARRFSDRDDWLHPAVGPAEPPGSPGPGRGGADDASAGNHGPADARPGTVER